jgi:hypothetical protein
VAPAVTAAALLAVLPAPASAATIHVFAGDSIQAAVKAADHGDEVVVHPGTYRESVAIKTNHLTLRGAGDRRGGSVIKPGSDKRCNRGRMGICVQRHKTSSGGKVPTKDTRVTGFRVQGFKDFGAGVFGARDTLFRNNTFVRNDEYGFGAFGARRTRVLHNVAKHAEEAGFYIGDSPHANAVLRRNRARRNGEFGFFIRDASHALVVHNRAVRNCLGIGLINTGAPGGVHDWGVRDNRALRNQRECIGGPEAPPISGTGIALLGARGNRVRHNVANGNRPSGPAAAPGGIVIASSTFLGGSNAANNRISHNRAHRNQPYDIVWDGNGQDNHFIANRCGSSQPDGLCD